MFAIYLIFTIAFLWFCLAGATLAIHRWCPHFLLAKSVSVVFFVLSLFFVEHFVGLGALNWGLPLFMAIAAWFFWKKIEIVKSREFIVAEIIFLAAFIYAFLWRFTFPSITPSSERMTDLFFITNYMQGATLPAVDNWNPPHLFDYYYAFQHYGAALLGRILNLSPGASYNYGFGLLGALPITLVVFVGQRMFAGLGFKYYQKIGLAALLTCAVAFGGNGLSPLLRLVYDSPNYSTFVKAGMNENAKAQAIQRFHSAQANQSRDLIIGAARFIGSDRDKDMKDRTISNKALASAFFPDTKPVIQGKKMVLPSENLGYQYFLGDYHPTLGGFFLLALALALLFSLQPIGGVRESEAWSKRAQAGLTLCVPLMLITNTWTMPLLVVLIAAWMAYRLLSKLPIYWAWLIGGGVAGSFLIYPFMAGFLTSTLPTPVVSVSDEMRTPWPRFLALQWPVILLIAFGFWEGRARKIAWMFSALWLVLLAASELIYIDDPTAAHFSRTNTVMKWWGWIQMGAFVSLGALLMSSSTKWLRYITLMVLFVITATAGFELQRYWRHSGKFYAGDLDGHHWYTNNATNRQMFEYLEAAEYGIVLEPVLDNAYSNTSIYGIFNGKPVLLGWPSHLRTWHGNVPRTWILKEQIDRFYQGEKEDALAWLKSHDVEYVVFSPRSDNAKFDVINDQIKEGFAWHEFEHSRQRHTGIWVKVD